MNITFKGNPITLAGNQIKVGDIAPDFNLIGLDLSETTLKDTSGKRVFVVVPSLDTPVCDMEVKKFNEEASKLNDVSIYVISSDLPFAQARWCGANSVSNVKVLSDYKIRNFGQNYGVYINELGILTRAIFVLDENNNVIYSEYCSEVSSEPNYEAVLNIIK